MEIYADNGLAQARIAALSAVRAAADTQQRQDDRAAEAQIVTPPSEAGAQAKAESEAANFLAAQKIVQDGTLIRAEGAATGSVVDIRV